MGNYKDFAKRFIKHTIFKIEMKTYQKLILGSLIFGGLLNFTSLQAQETKDKQNNLEKKVTESKETQFKLAKVKRALNSNNDVVIVNVEEKIHLPERDGFWSHTVDFWVAPKKGLYTADELQNFMIKLIPDLEPSSKDDFREDPYRITFGKLYFDEKIGEERVTTKRVITLTDEKLFDLAGGFPDGKKTIETNEVFDYKRRIWVRLYPNEKFARDVLDGKLPSICDFLVEKDVLQKYK